MKFLDKLGHIALAIITFGARGAVAVAPSIAPFDKALADLITTTASQVILAQAAGTAVLAGTAGAGGDKKLALVISSIEPFALDVAKKYGISDPNQDQLEKFVNGIVASLNAFAGDTVPATA